MRRTRLDAGLSQEQLADLAGTDLTQVGGVEREPRNPSYSTLLRLAAAMETRVGVIASLADDLYDRRKR